MGRSYFKRRRELKQLAVATARARRWRMGVLMGAALGAVIAVTAMCILWFVGEI